MYEFAIIWDWLAFAVRWLHVITGIAWIGSSFYFVALDLGLKKVPHLPPGAYGEEWQVHGGGFYHIQKYLVAPERMPEHLVWFKWESYATWLSGFAMLAIVYYAGADLFLVDRTVLDIPAWAAIVISLAVAVGGLAVLRQPLQVAAGREPDAADGAAVPASWWRWPGATRMSSAGGRRCCISGAFTATIMSANVFLVIIPNQTIVVADLKAGRTPDPKYGAIAKLRSTHNNYLTLPVLFLMLSQPLSAGVRDGVELADRQPGVPDGRDHPALLQHHARDRQGKPNWTWAATAIIFVIIMWLSSAPGSQREELAGLSPMQERFASAAGFEAVADTVRGRCSMCHTAEPGWPGRAPRAEGGDPGDRRARSRRMRARSTCRPGGSHAMPPGNVSEIEPAERRQIVDWYRAAVSGLRSAGLRHRRK